MHKSSDGCSNGAFIIIGKNLNINIEITKTYIKTERVIFMAEFFKRSKTQQELEIEDLKKELEHCKFLIQRNETFFNMSWDEDLIAAQIYERESLRCQYNYLINRLKEKSENALVSESVKVGE